MERYKFTGELQDLIEHAENGTATDVEYIMKHLTNEASLAMTRYVDYALSIVENENGISKIKEYLFNGSPIQRNYSCLFFNRRGDWELVNEAYRSGCIDEIQAFAR